MKTVNFFTRLVLLVLATSFGAAYAIPSIDTLNVQGFMKKADNTAVTNGTYNIVFAVSQNGTVIWGREYSTVIASGLFSRNLSGAGQDLSAGTWAHCTGGVNADLSATTLNPAALVAGATGALVVKVCARSSIDGSQPQFDLTLSAVPTAFVAAQAAGVTAGAVTVTGIATASKANASAGAADAGKIVLLDAGGLLDTTLLPVVPVANGGTGGATAAAARTGIGAAAAGSNADITEITGLTTDLTVAQGGTGASTAAGARTNIGAAASGANADITELTGLTTMLALNQGGTAKNMTAAAGAVAYSDADSLELTAAGTAGQVLTSAGTGAPTWSSMAVGSNSSAVAYTDFLGHAIVTGPAVGLVAEGFFGSAVGAGSLVSSAGITGVAGRPGIMRLSTGTTATGSAALLLCNSTQMINTLLGGGAISFEAAINLPALSTAVQEYIVRFGFFDVLTSGAVVDGAYIDYVRTGSVNWRYATVNNSTLTGPTASATAVSAATWHKLRVDVNAGGTQVDFYLNGVSLGSSTTNIPTGAGRVTCPGLTIVKTVGTTASTMDVDFMSFSQTLTTPR